MLDRRGSALINVLGLISIISVITAGIFYSLNRVTSRSEGTGFYGLTISMITEQVSSLIENDYTWLSTIVNNPGMACLLNPGAVCPNTYSAFDLYMPDSSVYLAHLGGTGFDKNGFSCNSYSSTTPDFKCTYKVKLFWKCAEADCTSAKKPTELFAHKPKITISMQFFYNSSADSNSSEISITHNSLEFIRGNVDGGLKAFCESISGELLAGGLHCRINPPTSYNCRVSASRHMVDKLEYGQVDCVNPSGFGDGVNPFKCNAGSAITGFLDDHPACDVF